MKVLVLGGTRFFGKHLAQKLIASGHHVTLLNRGRLDDGLGKQVHRIQADRQNPKALGIAVRGLSWDIVSKSMNTNVLRSLGLRLDPSMDWMSALVSKLSK